MADPCNKTTTTDLTSDPPDYRAYLVNELHKWRQLRDACCASGDTHGFQHALACVGQFWWQLQRTYESAHDARGATD